MAPPKRPFGSFGSSPARPNRERGKPAVQGQATSEDIGARAPVRPSDKRKQGGFGGSTPARARPATEPRGRFEKPPLVPQVTTLWEYPSQHYGATEQGRKDYRGATPSYVIWNVLHRFTKEGDTVVDPFCGSGTTLDVCTDLGRLGKGFDLQATRPDIVVADARSLPLKDKSVHLVFMDPPYADNLAYSDDARCIGKLPADGRYQRAMRLALAEANRVLKDEGVLAIYVCDVFQKNKGFFPLGLELFEMARTLGLRPLDHVAVVRHNRTLEQGNYRKAADEGGFFLRGFNHLMLFRKTTGKALAGASGKAGPATDELPDEAGEPSGGSARFAEIELDAPELDVGADDLHVERVADAVANPVLADELVLEGAVVERSAGQ
jgi:adenine-specific DNA-methyltransferase